MTSSENFTIQANLDLRKISTCKLTYIELFFDNLFLDLLHKSFLNQTTLDLRNKSGVSFKGGIMSEDIAGFLLLPKNIPKTYLKLS